MPYGANQTVIRYRNDGEAPVELEWQPLVTLRWFHQLVTGAREVELDQVSECPRGDDDTATHRRSTIDHSRLGLRRGARLALEPGARDRAGARLRRSRRRVHAGRLSHHHPAGRLHFAGAGRRRPGGRRARAGCHGPARRQTGGRVRKRSRSPAAAGRGPGPGTARRAGARRAAEHGDRRLSLVRRLGARHVYRTSGSVPGDGSGRRGASHLGCVRELRGPGHGPESLAGCRRCSGIHLGRRGAVVPPRPRGLRGRHGRYGDPGGAGHRRA